jgi:preprotein translocase subunit SecY
MTRHGRATAGGVEHVLVALLGLVAGGTAVVWLAGNLASLLAGSGTLGIGFGETANVVTQLPDAIDDPAQAWPASIRDQLPGPATILIALILAFVVVFAAIIGVLLVVMRMLRMRHPDHGAQWAKTRDLRALKVKAPERGRLMLGRHGGGRTGGR